MRRVLRAGAMRMRSRGRLDEHGRGSLTARFGRAAPKKRRLGCPCGRLAAKIRAPWTMSFHSKRTKWGPSST